MFFLFIYAPVYVTMRHADSPMYYFCHVIDYKTIKQLKTRNLAGFLVFNLKISQAVISYFTVIRSYVTFLANMVAN